MKVYRWEKDTIGPYNYNYYDIEEENSLGKYLINNHIDIGAHPNWDTDFGESKICQFIESINRFTTCPLLGKEDLRSGFKSLGQMRKWFTKQEREMLRNNGFTLKVYNILPEYCLVSEHQVIFVLPEYIK